MMKPEIRMYGCKPQYYEENDLRIYKKLGISSNPKLLNQLIETISIRTYTHGANNVMIET